MADNPTHRRLFSEKEISGILKRAAEFQEATGPTDATGLSLDELKQIAAEVGIDPQHVAAAVAEMEQGGTAADKQFQWLGGPVSFSVERVVEGDVSEEQWEEMVDEIRRSLNLVGTSGQVGRSLEWTHRSRLLQMQVAVTSREGQTRIRIFSRYPKQALLTFLPALIMTAQLVLIASASAGLAPLVGFVVGINLLTALFFLLRFAFRGLTRRKERKARHLLDRLEQIITTTDATPARTALPEEVRLDPSLLDREDETTESPSPEGVRRKISH
ncbi:MAG: hypothetical protein ACE5G0_15875 [Rhodothermales bacterium]